MKIYEFNLAPNAKRVSLFLAEKGIEIERVPVDIRGGENLSEDFLLKNPNGLIPFLELDDGSIIAESLAICRYIELSYPEKAPLFGTDAKEQATIEMWQRMVEFKGLIPSFQAFRNISGVYSDRETCVAEWGEVSKQRLLDFLPTLDKQLAENAFIAGDRFSVADISAYILLFFAEARLDITLAKWANLRAWQTSISQREATQKVFPA